MSTLSSLYKENNSFLFLTALLIFVVEHNMQSIYLIRVFLPSQSAPKKHNVVGKSNDLDSVPPVCQIKLNKDQQKGMSCCDFHSTTYSSVTTVSTTMCVLYV